MIRRTFQLAPGVGPWREKDLWARGIDSWDAFPSEGVVMSTKLDDRARARIAQAQSAHQARDLKRLAALFPPREHWRLYGDFWGEAVFFDIETDGQLHQRPTAVSLYSREGLEVFIQGRNLGALPAALEKWPIWVTFNGSCFDVPVLRKHFGALAEPVVHLDLRFICRKLQLSGGLKAVEDGLGIARPLHLRGVNGWDAVLLWRAYVDRGDVEALRFLVEYNLYDAFQLKSVMDVAYNQAARSLGCDEPPLPVFDRGEVLYDVSRLLLELGVSQSDLRALQRARDGAPARARYLL